MNIKTTVYDTATIILPKIEDDRGNLTFIESLKHIPFEIERVYWIYDVPAGASRGVYDNQTQRGGHAYRTLQEGVIALSGSFDVVLDDGASQKITTLNRAYECLFIPSMIWRRFQNFSTNAVAFVVASQLYNPEDYIRDYNEFIRIR